MAGVGASYTAMADAGITANTEKGRDRAEKDDPSNGRAAATPGWVS